MRKIWVLFTLAAMLMLVIVTPALALDDRSGVVVHVAAGETVSDDMILTGESITIDGTVNGDVFAFGNTIFVNGTINGNLIGAGRTIVIKGHVTGGAFTAGDSVIVRGRVERSLVSASSTAIMEQGASVGRSWLGASDHLEHAGTVGAGMAVAASRVNLNGRVAGEMRAAVDSLEVSSNAEVVGPLTYWSENEARVAPGAQVAQLVRETTNRNWNFEIGPWFLSPLLIALKFGGFLLAGILILALFPGLRDRFPALLFARSWQSVLAGLVALIAFPVVTVVLMLTVIGIPLGMLALVSLPALIYISQVLVSWTVGRFLADRIAVLNEQRWPVVFLAGAAATTLLVQLPVIGCIVSAAFFFAGLGALYFTAVGRQQLS